MQKSRTHKTGSQIKKQKCTPIAQSMRIFGMYSRKKPQSIKKNISNKYKADNKENFKKMYEHSRIQNFPITSIKFKDNRSRIKSNKAVKQNSTIKTKNSNNFTRIDAALNDISFSNNKIQRKIETEEPLFIEPFCDMGIVTQQSKFKQALTKIFKDLDIFGREVISETNINKWMPESALYFLGQVFQKIRQERLKLNLEQFTYLCMPILYASTNQDIQWFISETIGKSQPKNQPKTIIERNHTSQSKVQKKIQIQKFTERIRPLCRQKQQYDQVLLGMRQKQKQVLLKMRQIRQAQQQAISPFLQQKSKEVSTFDGLCIKYRQHNVPPAHHQDIRFSDKKDKKKDSQNERNSCSYYKNPVKVQKNHNLVSDFVIQKEDFIKKPRQIQYSEQQTQRQILFEKNYPQSIKKSKIQVIKAPQLINQTVPMRMHQQLTKSSKRDISQSKFSTFKEEDTKIDVLNNKLEQYIKMNAQKIQKSRKVTKKIKNQEI